MTEKTEAQLIEEAKAAFQQAVDTGIAPIGESEYHFGTFTHKERRKVFAFFSRSDVQKAVSVKDFSFLEYPEFDAIETLILDKTLLNGSQLSKMPNWLDDYASDYLVLIPTAMAVISAPFMQGNRTA